MPADRSPLGQATDYPDHYDASVLFAVDRGTQRTYLSVPGLPFTGIDIWTAYEITWLDRVGKPQVAIGEFRVGADSPAPVGVSLHPLSTSVRVAELAGESIDASKINMERYQPDPTLLGRVGTLAEETLRTSLFRSNCPVTGQPDYADVMVHYRGPRIDREALLRYFVSYREHAAFHEACVERMFVDIALHCRPDQLTVYARFLRRGGIDINPFRSNFEPPPVRNERTPRQ
jgi:7-cyano-7-deazaguanine reductase